jgi:hypothetical protein
VRRPARRERLPRAATRLLWWPAWWMLAGDLASDGRGEGSQGSCSVICPCVGFTSISPSNQKWPMPPGKRRGAVACHTCHWPVTGGRPTWAGVGARADGACRRRRDRCWAWPGRRGGWGGRRRVETRAPSTSCGPPWQVPLMQPIRLAAARLPPGFAPGAALNGAAP